MIVFPLAGRRAPGGVAIPYIRPLTIDGLRPRCRRRGVIILKPLARDLLVRQKRVQPDALIFILEPVHQQGDGERITDLARPVYRPDSIRRPL